MNAHCQGDYFPSLGLYRCLKDGDFKEVKSAPETCENCGRKTDLNTYENPEIRTVHQVKINLYPDCWVNIPVDLNLCLERKRREKV